MIRRGDCLRSSSGCFVGVQEVLREHIVLLVLFDLVAAEVLRHLADECMVIRAGRHSNGTIRVERNVRILVSISVPGVDVARLVHPHITGNAHDILVVNVSQSAPDAVAHMTCLLAGSIVLAIIVHKIVIMTAARDVLLVIIAIPVMTTTVMAAFTMTALVAFMTTRAA